MWDYGVVPALSSFCVYVCVCGGGGRREGGGGEIGISPRGSRVPDDRSTSSALASAGLDSRSGGLLARTSRSRWGLDDPPIRSPR